MNHFPLSSFLISLEADGFRLTVRDYGRIAWALGTGGEWTVIRLRCVLTALLAKDKEQRTNFQRRFDEFYDLKLEEKSTDLRIDVQKVLEDIQRFTKKRRSTPFKPRRVPRRFIKEDRQPVLPLKSRFRRSFLMGTLLVFALFCAVAVFKMCFAPSPILTVSPEKVDFGSRILDNETQRSITLTDSCAAIVTIDFVRLTGESPTSFAIKSDNCSQAELGKKGRCEIQVGFIPKEEGEFKGALRIAGNFKDSPEIIELEGRGEFRGRRRWDNGAGGVGVIS
jgi:hypothetical protein